MTGPIIVIGVEGGQRRGDVDEDAGGGCVLYLCCRRERVRGQVDASGHRFHEQDERPRPRLGAVPRCYR